METSSSITSNLQRILILSGFLSAFLILGTDILAGKLLKGYSFSVQSMSELGAEGSPTRQLLVIMTIISSGFMIAFGFGVWRELTPAMLPKVVAGLIIGNSVAGLVATLFFPNRFGIRPVFASPGVLIMAFSVFCFVLAMIVGAIAFHGWMRILSILIPAAYILLTIMRFAIQGSPAGSTLVIVGIQERTMSYSYLLWVIALAFYLF